MKKDFLRKKLSARAITAFLVLVLTLGAGVAYAQPILVMQPAYTGMQFYIQQPQCIPANWFTTFDGYPVWRGADGVWFYGSFSNNTIVQTNFIVGSVVPSHAGLSPYVVQLAAASPVPLTQTVAVAPVAVERAPMWLSVNFMALGNWRRNVDRVGLLARPSIPVAWRGMWPQVLYAWTGSSWYQMIANEGERPGDVLRRNLYVLTRLTHQNGNRQWRAPEDVAFLTNRTAQWGFIWMGIVGPNPTRVY